MAERQTKSWSPLITNIVSGITILLTSTVLGLAIKINDNVAENSTKIARIEGNRFTSAHGLEVWRAIGEIKADIAKLPQEVPPPWFVDRVDRIEQSLNRIVERLDRMEHR